MARTNARLLEQVPQHTWDDPAYLGWALQQWRLHLGWTWDQVARDLGVLPEVLYRMMLHQRPDPLSLRYTADLQVVCRRYQARYLRLAEICRFAALAA